MAVIYIYANISLGCSGDVFGRGTQTLEFNAMANKIYLFSDTDYSLRVPFFTERGDVAAKFDFPIIYYIQKNDIRAKIEIMKGVIKLYPSEPLKFRKSFNGQESALDLNSYIILVIEICERFPIYELKICTT